ncbi:alpha/beta fold hydrolase [Pararhodobacter zhoushanensis]|uniref:Alpha/beta fold hydrolase n=1 Tax=Pararhodobacter zhoushanensis TaxID=2479545 RepID=A0ABT3H1C4_9RHOB|nr:alpha/beta fold hydrolase [Pararhodobacter zhoushanensis]MCW1933579.1 alpha/beta fold hydrolase [Pararhodobacter zhoushanensis]
MPYAHNGPVAVHYDTQGTGVPVVMLAGAGRPASDFDAVFCAPLLAQGFMPLRIDSRDTGRSASFAGQPARLAQVRQRALGQDGAPPPYALGDMAGDVLAVLDHAGIERAHLVGRSLGAMVAQAVAIAAPARVLSLSLIMASSRTLPAQVPEAVLDRLEAEQVTTAEDYVARQLRVAAANGLAQDYDAARIAGEARLAWAHGIAPGATARHFAVSLAAGDLRPGLAGLHLPALILHGRQDALIPLIRAEECAAALPGAQLEVIEDMAHDGPPRLRRRWGARIAAHLASL